MPLTPRVDRETLRVLRAPPPEGLGLTNSEIGRRVGLSRQRVAQILGPQEHYTGARVSLTVEVKASSVEVLRTIAADLGYTSGTGTRAGQGNIRGMLDAIADGRLLVRAQGHRIRR